MTIVLVILAVLILLAVLFLIFHVSKLSKAYRELITDYHTLFTNNITNLENNVVIQVNRIVTALNNARTDVAQLTNKVEEGDNCCKVGLDSLRDIIANLNDRLTAPIDKINDTHNRIKTLGKGATSTDELRKVVEEVVSGIATEIVDSVCQKCAPKPKVAKKAPKKPVTEVKA